jgi:hypothetical protein
MVCLRNICINTLHEGDDDDDDDDDDDNNNNNNNNLTTTSASAVEVSKLITELREMLTLGFK